MCMFKRATPQNLAQKYDMHYFNCGQCPECLRQKASAWALRAVYEARSHKENCMITLTYDTYEHDSRGRIIGERVSDLKVCKSDCQKFIKRLRKRFPDKPFKYMIAAEYGKRTHRAHYHVLLFGLSFSDARLYKKSKRGNWIFKSKKLEKIWQHGICTIDKLDVTAAAARYCTKYISKDKGMTNDETFMLFSHGIGIEPLLRDFNGKSYIIDGREYPIPRLVWQRYITQKYADRGVDFSPRYVNRKSGLEAFNESKRLRDMYAVIRNDDEVYLDYLSYWKEKSAMLDIGRSSDIDRIRALPDNKYFIYKQRALLAKQKHKQGIPVPIPRTKGYKRYVEYLCNEFYYKYEVACDLAEHYWDLASTPCPKTPNDTKKINYRKFLQILPLRPSDEAVFLRSKFGTEPPLQLKIPGI